MRFRLRLNLHVAKIIIRGILVAAIYSYKKKESSAIFVYKLLYAIIDITEIIQLSIKP